MNRSPWLLLLLVSCAPAWPDGAALTTGRVTGTSVELVWPAATEGSAVDVYRVFRGEEIMAQALAGNASRFVVGGLEDGERYPFSVRAGTSGGDWSSALELEVTTPDVTAPKWTQPPRFVVTVESETETSARLRLAWTGVEDNLGVHEIVIHHPPPGESVTIGGEAREHALESAFPDGIWQLEAKDAAGNTSEALGFQVETELTPVRRATLKDRAREVFAERADGGDANLLGPDGLGVKVESPGRVGSAPVWLGEGGRAEARAFTTSRLAAIEACYHQARRQDAALSGLLTVTLVISAKGEVNASRMEGIKHSGLRTCARKALRGQLAHAPSASFRTEIPVHMNLTQ